MQNLNEIRMTKNKNKKYYAINLQQEIDMFRSIKIKRRDQVSEFALLHIEGKKIMCRRSRSPTQEVDKRNEQKS